LDDVRTVLNGDVLTADRVIDGSAAQEGKPLSFAEVRLYAGAKLIAQMTTDEQGHFLLENLPLGRFRLSFKGLGTFNIQLDPPKLTQQCFYSFGSYHGCLDWGLTSD
jgi:hypothetical protein